MQVSGLTFCCKMPADIVRSIHQMSSANPVVAPTEITRSLGAWPRCAATFNNDEMLEYTGDGKTYDTKQCYTISL